MFVGFKIVFKLPHNKDISLKKNSQQAAKFTYFLSYNFVRKFIHSAVVHYFTLSIKKHFLNKLKMTNMLRNILAS